MTASRRRRIGLALASALALLVLLELGARAYLQWIASPARRARWAFHGEVDGPGGRQAMFVRHTYIGYRPRPGFRHGRNYHNTLGLRGDEFPVEKPDGELRVVCIGGSTTYTPRVEAPHQSYPARLEAELRARGHEQVRVINAGCPGWTSWESLIHFQQRLLVLEPDVAVVYHGVNDVGPRLVWPPEAYQSDNSGYRGTPPALLTPGVLEYSALARIAMIEAGWIEPHTTLGRSYAPSGPNFLGARLRRQRSGTGRALDVLPAGVTLDDVLDANPPLHFERNLFDLCRLAEAHDVAVVLATFAWTPHRPDRTTPAVTLPAYERALAEHDAVLRRVAERTDARLFDLAAAMPTTEEHFSDWVHVTAAGAQEKARLVAEFLLADGFVR